MKRNLQLQTFTNNIETFNTISYINALTVLQVELRNQHSHTVTLD